MHSNETFTCFNGPCRLLHFQISFWFLHQSHSSMPLKSITTFCNSSSAAMNFFCGDGKFVICLDCHTPSPTKELHHKRNFGRSTINILNAAILGRTLTATYTKRMSATKNHKLNVFFTTALFSVSSAKNTKSIASWLAYTISYYLPLWVRYFVSLCDACFCLCLFSANC